MIALTTGHVTYKRPRCRYVVPGGFTPVTGWELVDGCHKRQWVNRATRVRRIAYVERCNGGWRWRVAERGPRGRLVQVAVCSPLCVKPLADMCYGAAEVSAESK